MEQSISEGFEEAMAIITIYGLDVIGAIAILVIGWIADGWISGSVNRALGRVSKMDETLRRFAVSAIRYLILVITVIAVLSQFGVEMASLLVVLSTAGLAIGLALQGTLSNVAAGVMLLLFRPFKIGDYVDVGGHAGTVKGITLFVTEMATPDNVHIVVPNGQVWGSSVVNYSQHPTRRVDIAVGIGYEDDINKAFAEVLDLIEADERAMAEPAPLVAVTGLGDNSVDLTLRVWCQAADYWGLKFGLTKAIKERFDETGINIPYPQRTVHIVNEAAD
ncbi:MAG: mechanosensitive ion channel [Proteobacteria bacterium]|nr:mechanosensitive ion channel [Pseudomonadota bacterium]